MVVHRDWQNVPKSVLFLCDNAADAYGIRFLSLLSIRYKELGSFLFAIDDLHNVSECARLISN